MSIATVTPKQVSAAIRAWLLEVANLLPPLYGDAATLRLFNLPANTSMEDFVSGSDPQDPTLFTDGVGYYAESLAAYAWHGDNAGGQHPEDSWPEVHTLGEVAAALADRVTFDLSHRNGSVFGDVRIGEDRAVDIIKWVVDAFKARGRIDWLGGDISIEELAALAKVSEKTLRMAANPKSEGALKTTKRGHRTFITTEDAMDWLARRPDFVPTRNPKQAFQAELHIGGGSTQLKAFLADLTGRQPALQAIASESGLSEAEIAALFAGELGGPSISLEPDVLARFAAKAGIERASSFVRWVLDLQYRERISRLEAAYKRQVMTLAPASEGDSQ